MGIRTIATVAETTNITASGIDAAAIPKAGSIAFFCATSTPEGWLKANGALVSRTTYSALFAAIGTTFGAGDGSTTFALPDLRGEFIRCVDEGRGVDPWRALGSAQDGEIQAHDHARNPFGALEYVHVGSGTGGGAYYGSTPYIQSHIRTGVQGGAETRPRNIALLACIKY